LLALEVHAGRCRFGARVAAEQIAAVIRGHVAAVHVATIEWIDGMVGTAPEEKSQPEDGDCPHEKASADPLWPNRGSFVKDEKR
jgi:hypothetical protein